MNAPERALASRGRPGDEGRSLDLYRTGAYPAFHQAQKGRGREVAHG